MIHISDIFDFLTNDNYFNKFKKNNEFEYLTDDEIIRLYNNCKSKFDIDDLGEIFQLLEPINISADISFNNLSDIKIKKIILEY